MVADSEDRLLKSTALKNAKSILAARRRVENELIRAKDALLDSQERLQAALSIARTGTYRWDFRDGSLVWDENLDSLFGQVPGEQERSFKGFLANIHPDDQPAVRRAHECSRDEGMDIDIEFRVLWPDGSVHWLENRAKVIKSGKNKAQHLTGACTDITRYKRAEEALLDSAHQFELALDAGNLASWSWDAKTDVVLFGERAKRLLGIQPGTAYTWEEMRQSLHPDDRERARLAVEKALATHTDYAIEYRATRPTGERCWLAAHGRGRYGPDGNPIGMIGVIEDITERKQAEAFLRDSEERLRATFTQAAVGIAIANLDGRFVEMNQKFCEVLGYSEEELKQKTFLELTHPADIEKTQDSMRLLNERRIPAYTIEKRYLRKDQSIVWSMTSVTLLRNENDEPQSYIGVINDISARVKAREALSESEEFNRSIIESSRDCIKTLALDGTVLWASNSSIEALDLPNVEAIVGKSWIELWQGADQAAASKAVLTAAEGGTGRFVGMLPVAGKKRWWNVVVSPIHSKANDVRRLLAVSRDVTDRILVDQALREKTRTLEILNRTGITLASQLDLQKIVQAVTDAGTELSGAHFGAFFYNQVNEQGESFMLYTLSGAPREAFEKFGQPRATALFGPTFRGEGIIRLGDVLKDSRYAKTSKGMPPGHLPVRSYLAVPVHSRTGAVIGGLFFGHPDVDVFDERSEQLVAGLAAQAAVAIDNAMLYEEAQKSAKLREQLLESERAARSEAERLNASKDEFLATLSHELRTPLSSVIGWAQILRRPEITAEDRQKGLETIERNARVQAQLIDDLLDMSKIASGKVRLDSQPLLPYSFVEAAIETIRPAVMSKGVRLETVIDPSAGPVSGDPHRLQQVVWNLLTNATKFTPRDGKIQVVLARVNSHIEISVADTGIGIKPDFLPYVFERFRQADASTTRKYGGLGLGLAIVKKIVELHGGTVQAMSPGEGQGATFVIRLPLMIMHRPLEQTHAHPVGPPVIEREFVTIDLTNVRVLVVDDEPDARELIQRALQDCGAKVVTAESARAALELIKQERPTVLISDIGMPEMDGYELLSQVRALEAGGGRRIPAIALTAFARSQDRTRALRAGFLVHVAKPVDPSELVATVASVADRTGPPAKPA